MQTSSTSSLAPRLLAGANVAFSLMSVFVIGELVMVALGRASYQGKLLIDVSAAVFGIFSLVLGIRSLMRPRTMWETMVLGAVFSLWIVFFVIGVVR